MNKKVLSRQLHEHSLGLAITLLVLLMACGTVGYHFLEDWPWIESLYMTIITVSTVGYGEIHSLTPMGRVFTMGLILSSLGIAGFGVSAIGSFILEGQLNRLLQGRRMDRELAKLKDHIILCGAGPTGKRIAEEFIQTETPFVLIDHQEESIRQVTMIKEIPFINGDATEDETLLLAGIDRASGLVTALSDDKENVFVVLTAKSLNPHIKIVTRMVEETNAHKLQKAGADEIISPSAIGGLRMASVMIRPAAVQFLDAMLRAPDKSMRVNEFPLKSRPHLHGKSLADLNVSHRTGLLVLAVLHPNGHFTFNPTGKTKLLPDDTLIVTGTGEQMSRLKNLEVPVP